MIRVSVVVISRIHYCLSAIRDQLPIRLVCCVLAGAMWLVLPTIASSENPADEHVRVELVSAKDAIVPNQQLWVGIRFNLQEGWHTYWVNPGDSGEPPRIDWELPAGFQVGPLQWPYPTRLPIPPFLDFGYERQVLLSVGLRPPSGLTEGTSERIAAHIHYLVCRDVCIPGQKELVLLLPVKNRAVASSDFPLFDATRERLPRPTPETWKISATSTGGEFLIRLRIGRLATNPEFFPIDPEQIENAAPQNATEIPGAILLHLKKSNHLLKPISRIQGVMVVSGTAYQVDVPVSRFRRTVHRRSQPN
jgi:DsbC/DsbD-like thiol-disulfide interchange protein